MAATLSILIASLGRPSLRDTLASIRGLRPGDEVVIVFDGMAALRRGCGMWDEAGLPGRMIVVTAPDSPVGPCGQPFNDFGHTPRNLALPRCRGEFISQMDDDDVYSEGAISLIHKVLDEAEFVSPHFFRMRYIENGGLLWHRPEVKIGNISSQLFVFPNENYGSYASCWGGDFTFIRETVDLWAGRAPAAWHEETIAIIRGEGGVKPEDWSIHGAEPAPIYVKEGILCDTGNPAISPTATTSPL